MNIPDSLTLASITMTSELLRISVLGGGAEMKKKKREGKGLREREEEGENRQHSRGRIRPPRFAYLFWAYEPWENL